MSSKEYTLPNGKKAVFEYDMFGIGMISLECMDELMAIIADRPQGEWVPFEYGDEKWHKCTACGVADRYIEYVERPNGTTGKLVAIRNYCPNCGARMRPRLQGKHFDSIIIDESAMKGADDEH